MKRKITALALSLFLLAGTAGCAPSADVADTSSANDTETLPETTAAETTGSSQISDIRHFGFREIDGGYSYTLYNLDGSVAEAVEYCEDIPSHDLLDGNISKITIGREVYYYDLETRVFSETFTDVFHEFGNLLVREEEGKIVVCDIFDEAGFYTEIDGFSYELSDTEESPFVSVEFIDDGGSVKCVYLSGEDGAEFVECFNISNGTRFTLLDDWKNKKELLSGDERESVESYLYSYMGSVDYNTGFAYAYEVSGALVINGERYYCCECFYVMEKDDGTTENVSCAEFVLSEDKQERYDCRDKDGALIVYTENDFH